MMGPNKAFRRRPSACISQQGPLRCGPPRFALFAGAGMGHAQLQETSGCTQGLVRLRLKVARRVAAPQGLLWASAVGGVACRLASRAAPTFATPQQQLKVQAQCMRALHDHPMH